MNYKRNTATRENVLEHLKKCNNQFVPNLDTKVDLQRYAEKIITYAEMFEAWKDDELIGLVAAYFNEDTRVAFITNVSILRQYNGRGIASHLVEECISFAEESHFSEIKLRVGKQNTGAIGLYSKLDFQETGHEGEELLMQKELNS